MCSELYIIVVFLKQEFKRLLFYNKVSVVEVFHSIWLSYNRVICHMIDFGVVITTVVFV